MEVTKHNFESVFPLITSSIESADFLAIDTEFTGLHISSDQKGSLFDTGEARYQKLRKSVTQFTISQLGLSAFVKNPERNKYEAHTFNFYLFPRAIGCLERTFMCQSSCLDFLVKHKFDFNKFAYEGISYLNEKEENVINKMIESKDMYLGNDRDLDNEALQNLCSDVAKWLVSAKEGERLKLKDFSDLHTYMLHWEIRDRFHQVWTEDENGEFIIVYKVKPEERKAVEKHAREQHDERVKNEMLGFTRVFRAITASKKLLLGHNNWTDLMLMHDKFYKPLPVSYKEFKRNISQLFPFICDTKHIVANLRRPLEDTGLLESTSLSKLYESLTSDKGRTYSLYSPDIVHAMGFDKYISLHLPHEAGYDAYMCGYAFLRMVHLYTTQGISSTNSSPVTFHQYLHKIKPFMNSVNMIRGAADHFCLDTEDPVSRRPQWLFIRSKRSSYSLRSSELARLFSTYGSVDVQIKSTKYALIAVSNHKSERDILKAFYKHNSISVTRYSLLKHSPIVKAIMWGGLCVFVGLAAWSLSSAVKIELSTEVS